METQRFLLRPVWLVLVVVFVACGGPTPPSPSSSAIAQSSPSASVTAAPTPTATASPATPSPRPAATAQPRATPRPSPKLAPRPAFDLEAAVWTVSPNLRVRSKPRVSSDSVKYEPLLPKGTVLSLLEGPVTGSGYWWYKVELLDTTLRGGRTTGWVAAGDHDGTPWIDWLPDGLNEGLDEPDPLRPTPVLGFEGTQDYTADGVAYTAYHLFVVNWRDYPAELFEPSADLEPCRGGPSRTRTWVTIIDTDGDQYLNGFCALSEPADLDALWFALPKGSTRPSAVYVLMRDRLTDSEVQSNTVRFTF